MENCDRRWARGWWGGYLYNKPKAGDNLKHIVHDDDVVEIVRFAIFHVIWAPLQDECQVHAQYGKHRKRIRHEEHITNTRICPTEFNLIKSTRRQSSADN